MEIIDLGNDGRVHRVRFMGIVYRRYPGSRRASDRSYFRAGIGDVRKGRSYLHRDLWVAVHGGIPDGFEVDHKDGDTLNNIADNLQLLTSSEHGKKHGGESSERGRKRFATMDPSKRADMLAKAAEWHRSEQGKEWHRQHGRTVAESVPMVPSRCEQCERDFTVKQNRASVTRFCSNNCKSANRRKCGSDNAERKCSQCGSLFVVNRYARKKYCSRPCLNSAVYGRSEAGVQPQG